MLKLTRFAVVMAAWAFGLVVVSTAAEKPKITSQDQLPRFEYPVTGPVTDILTDEAAYTALATAVRADLEKLLADYDIEDRTTLQGIIGTLMSMDFQAGDYDSALAHLATIRELESKPANKLTAGHLMESVIEARSIDYATDAAYRAAFAKIYAEKINALPFEIVGDNIKSSKASAEIVTESLLVGAMESQVQPGVDKTGTISGDVAQGLIGRHVSIASYIPLREERAAVLQAFIDANFVAKADIWAARNVVLTDHADLHPVTIAIWDSGIDTAVYPDNLWSNPAEKADGIDNDENGFIDDLHGIAFDLHSNREPELLAPLTAEQQAAYPAMRDMTKGLLDLQASIDSPEATAIKQHMGSIEPDKVQQFFEDLGLFGNFTHGTHVAGIAAAGNPAARLMAARITFDFRTIPDVPTMEQAIKDAEASRDVVAYFRDHGVRVVNMSWGGSPQGIEAAFEANGAGGTPEERRVKSREMFDVALKALTEAMRDAPDILFVVAAGNSDNDAEFSDLIPSGIDLPNILTVGAVDQAGEETSFSTFGSNVDVHANGFEVPSHVPGGEEMNYSGTSMAAPNVANLAGKLLAVAPDLTTSQLVSLITLGAQRNEDGRINLISPKRSFELLAVVQSE
ncbi:S8 family serine peptidase [Synoicihabitans lomoniglobus]|uniref:S8 family serine peptidase n=1 Tax=Synoicihabitans lomoniglobus TaxID=2909285 RepID=A0AAE9ZUG5_9BACT|nr:S8 family serine peptidase [Opitutaceae bacterium LMO-M01]WED65385.1 S8 family serine peptidase [Opitutaceae bacterium LMO-M01]